MNPPYRLCCMERHFGPECPDGKVMCCLCFNRFELKGLSKEDGKLTDVCKACRHREITRGLR